MSVLSIVLMSAAVTSAAQYECALDKGVTTMKRISDWEFYPLDNPKSRNGIELKGFSFSMDNVDPQRVTVISVGDPLHLVGRFQLVRLSPNLVSWSVPNAANCSLIDAKCAPSVQVFDVDNASAVAVVSLATFGAVPDRKQSLASINFFFSCKRQVAGQSK
jgi:hypothetical protein